MARSKKQTREDGRTPGGRFAKGHSGNPSGVKKPDEAIARLDAWMSSTTGIGHTSYDKRLSHQFYTDTISYQQAVEMWRGDDLAARAIEAVPAECFRQGYELTIGNETEHKSLREDVERKLEELHIDENVEKAFQNARAFGGGACLLGINDGQTMDKPVDLIRVSSLDYVLPLEAIELEPESYYSDQTKPKFGKPEIFRLTTSPRVGAQSLVPSTAIHESRLILFDGIRVSAYQTTSGTVSAFWGDSTLTRFANVLRDFNIAWQSAGIVVVDFATSVFTMENLVQLMASNRQSQIIERMRLLELGRSTARAVLIDSKEQFSRQTTPLTGLPDLLDRLSKRLAAAIDMPLTLLMGVAATGGSEGEADVRFFYDRVRQVQKRRIRPALHRIIQLVMWSLTKGEPDKWGIKFHSLWQPTDKEQAEARATQAGTDEKYVTMGVLTPEEVRRSRFQGDYSFETQLDSEFEQQGQLGEPDAAAMEAMGRDPSGAPMAPAGAPAEAPPSLNGAQVASLVDIVAKVVAGLIPRDGAVDIITASFPTVTPEKAKAMLGSSSFKPEVIPAGLVDPQATSTAPARKDYSPDQPRAENGQFGEGGGSSSSSSKESKSSGSSAPAPSSSPSKSSDTRDTHFKDGKWSEPRVAIHKTYTSKVTKNVPKSAEPTVYMTGGGPASGKTTGLLKNPAAKIPDSAKAAHIDPDGAKENIPEYKERQAAGDKTAAAHVHEESSHMAKAAVSTALKGGHDVVYDSVGDSGITKLSAKVKEMRDAGAKRVAASYATVDVEEAIRRSDERAAQTGRFVPHEYIRAAHKDVSQTVRAAVDQGVFDSLDVWDTSGAQPVQVATYTKVSGLKVQDQVAWDRFVARGK